MSQTRKKRRKRKSRIMTWLVVVLLWLLLAAVGTGLYLLVFAGNHKIEGRWSRSVDIAETVADNMEAYLKEATLGDEIDVKQYLEDMKIDSILQVTREGEWKEEISRESYEACSKRADQALKQAVTDLIKKRIEQSYIDTDKSIEELVKEAVGVSVEEYISAYGPVLMPDYEELEEKYGSTNTYTCDKEFITWTTGAQSCSYAITNGMLVIDYSEGAVVYHRREE